MKIFSKKYISLSIFLLSLTFTEACYPQSRLDSLDLVKLTISQNRLFSVLEKQLNTYNLSTFLRYSTKSDNYLFGLSENFKSSYIKGAENTVRDENQFQMFLINQLNQNFDLGVKFNNSILSDSRKLEINQSSISSLLLFTRLKYFEDKMILIPNIGFMNNRQIGENDSGLEYGFESEIKKIELYDIEIDSEVKIKTEDISPRKNYIRIIGFRLTNDFERNIINNFTFNFSKNRKDFYFPADSLASQTFNINNNIQSRTETHYFASNKLEVIELFNNLTFETEGKMSFRTISRKTRYKTFFSQIFDTEVDELRLEIGGALLYNSNKIKSSLRIHLNERDEKNRLIYYEGINQVLFNQRRESEEQKNNASVYGTLSFGTDYLISTKDRVSFNLYQSKLKYDTPSNLNDDDRDEILSIVKLEYNRIINPFLSVFINTEGSRSHLVYLFASQSSNNNVNRVLRLKTGSELNLSKISSTNIFEVSANYTSYDFEDLNSNLKSFSYRQFTALDSTQLTFSKRLNVNFLGYVKLSEQGDFNWSSFSERPKRYLKEIFLEPKLTFNYEKYYFSFGFRYFELSTYNYKNRDRIFDNSYKSYGPVSLIGARLFKSLSINFYGYFEIVDLSNLDSRQQANMNFSINWIF